MNIYQKIWNADQQDNGIQPLLPTQALDDERGYVVVNQAASGREGHKLFEKVHLPQRKDRSVAWFSTAGFHHR